MAKDFATGSIFIILYMILVCERNVAATRCKYKHNCICLERELEKDLKDDSPPHWKNDTFFSNAHNISRALYPPDSAPAKVINVEVTLYSGNKKSIRIVNYVWAISSIYTIFPPHVLGFVSLGTMYHTSGKLELSVREFCADVPGDIYLKNAIFSLEDLSITPTASDPRLNTAKYVVQKEEENKTLHFSIAVLVLQIIFSTCGGYCITFYWTENIVKNVDNCTKTAVKITTIFLLVLYCPSVFIFGLVVGLQNDSQTVNPVYLWILFTNLFVILAVLLVVTVARWRAATSGNLHSSQQFEMNNGYSNPKDVEPKDVEPEGAETAHISLEKSTFYFYPFSYLVCFHFSWVSIGVFSNPLWALPVLLTILTTIFLIFFGPYYKDLLGANTDSALGFLYAMFFVTFITYVAFTWISARSFFTNQLMASLIQTVLTAALGLTAPIWRLKKKMEKPNRSQQQETKQQETKQHAITGGTESKK